MLVNYRNCVKITDKGTVDKSIMDLEKGYETDLESSEEGESIKLESATDYRQLILLNMLSCVNAEDYLPILQHYNINHETIRLVRDEDLVAMGIIDKTHRRDLLNYISSLPPLQRKSNYENLEQPLLNAEIILNLSKHIDLLTLSLRKGLNASCCIRDLNGGKPNYKEIDDPIIYPEGVSSSEVAISTIEYTEKKIKELLEAISRSEELLGISKKKGVLKKARETLLPYLGIASIATMSLVFLKKIKLF